MIFFEQNHANQCDVVVVENARQISLPMGNSYGMEYFVSNSDISYLISVNWHAIEYVGDLELLPT